MKLFTITMPITGYVIKAIEAESQDEALNMFYDEELKWDDIEQIDYCEHVTKGNVTYALLNDMTIDVEDIEED
jgi:hypothetical protein